jgi:large repetitive protein
MIVKDIKITDPLPGLVISGGPITLGIGEVDSTSFTAKYPVTQADIDAGMVKNQATAAGKDPNGKDVTAISNDPKTNEGKDPTIVPLPTIGKIELLKVAQSVDGNGNGYSDIGDYINYFFAVKNVGSVTLTNVTVKDNKATVVGGPIAVLAPGESDTKTFTAKYMLTDADITAGKVENSAITNAKDPKGKDVSDISDSNDKSKTGDDDPTITPLVPKPIPPVLPTVRTGAGATYIMLSIASMIAAAFLMMNKKVRRA